MQRLTCTEGGASKFWEGWVEGSTFFVRFGKIGTDGQTKLKKLASPSAAAAELGKLVAEKRKKGYVDDGGKASASAKKGAASAKKGAAKKAAAPAKKRAAPAKKVTAPTEPDFPFLFYGADAGDWFEGAHSYEVRFQDAPTPKTRIAIARAFERAKGKQVKTSLGAWRWSGAWAQFSLDQGEDEDDNGPREFFYQVRKQLEAIHDVAPLAEVVLHGVREIYRGDRWTEWTVACQPVPTAAPDWDPGYDYAMGPLDRHQERLDGAPVVTDPSFERARKEAAKGRK